MNPRPFVLQKQVVQYPATGLPGEPVAPTRFSVKKALTDEMARDCCIAIDVEKVFQNVI
jgi:hypothetical protein